MNEDINCVFEGLAGVGAIYISNLKAAENAQLLRKLGIQAVVTVLRGGCLQHDKSNITEYLYVPADDLEDYDLSQHFQATYEFIDMVRRKTNVLVHCYAGISRSATIVIAYLLRKYNYSLQNVFSMVKRRRSKVNPNKGFIQLLKREELRTGYPLKNQSRLRDALKISPDKKRSSSTFARQSTQSKGRQTSRTSLIFNNVVKCNKTEHEQKEVNPENKEAARNLKSIELNQIDPASESTDNWELQKNRLTSLVHIPIAKVNENDSKIERLKMRVLESERNKKQKKRSNSDFKLVDSRQFDNLVSLKLGENVSALTTSSTLAQKRPLAPSITVLDEGKSKLSKMLMLKLS